MPAQGLRFAAGVNVQDFAPACFFQFASQIFAPVLFYNARNN